MIDVEIRTATEADADRIVDLWQQEPRSGDRDRSRVELLDAAAAPAELALVAVAADGEVVGAVIGFVTSSRAWLHHLAVRADRRRQGIADALVDEFEARARHHGADRVTILLWEDNDGGRGFWQRRGFQERSNVLYATYEMTPEPPGHDGMC